MSRLSPVLAVLLLVLPINVSMALEIRPPLQVHQGKYFRYAMPKGWRANETTNGVDIFAPDGITGASSALLINIFGQTNPQAFMEWAVRSAGYRDVKFERARNLPSQPGPMGMPWQVAESEITFTHPNGTRMRALLTAGVAQGPGQYSATMKLYQAPAKSWKLVKYWLPAIADSVVVTNPRQVAGLDRVQLPRNIPYDEVYGEYNKAWEARQASQDRLSQDRREATMGYERMTDPKTGQMYEVPFEYYDAKVGGYRNPNRPTELLVKPPPGE